MRKIIITVLSITLNLNINTGIKNDKKKTEKTL